MEIISHETVIYRLRSTTRSGVIRELLSKLKGYGHIKTIKDAYVAIMQREHESSTYVGKGIAIPHAKGYFANRVFCALGISGKGVNFGGECAYIVVLMVSSPEQTRDYIKYLTLFAKIFSRNDVIHGVKYANNTKDIVNIINNTKV